MTTPNERARAWDRYAAGCASRGQTPHFSADYADALLAERDKRFPPAPVEGPREEPPGQHLHLSYDWCPGCIARGVRDERERIANWLDSKAAGYDYIANREKSSHIGFLEWAIATLRSTPDDGKTNKP